MCCFFLIDIGYLAGDNSMSGYFIFMPQDKTVASIADAPGSSPSKTQRDCAHDEVKLLIFIHCSILQLHEGHMHFAMLSLIRYAFLPKMCCEYENLFILKIKS